MEYTRINGTHPEAKQEFYTMHEEIVCRFKIQRYNTRNMDEHSTATGVCSNSHVLGSSGIKRLYVKSP